MVREGGSARATRGRHGVQAAQAAARRRRPVRHSNRPAAAARPHAHSHPHSHSGPVSSSSRPAMPTARRTEHGPAGVDDLQLAVAGKGLRVGRQAGGVPAVVARELSGQVGGHKVLRVGAQELGAVGAVLQGAGGCRQGGGCWPAAAGGVRVRPDLTGGGISADSKRRRWARRRPRRAALAACGCRALRLAPRRDAGAQLWAGWPAAAHARRAAGSGGSPS